MRRLSRFFIPIPLLASWGLQRAAAASSSAAATGLVTLGPSVFTAPGVFPTSVYKSYYNDPTATTAQPQPVISDPVTVSKSVIDGNSTC